MNETPQGSGQQNIPEMMTAMPQRPVPAPAPANPLLNYYRQPKVYVQLPSKGKFYPPGVLDASEDNNYAVFAMTAKDELILKTPDALMNGQATVEVIKSCVPAIKDPWQMPSIDMDAVLISIRIATYGELMPISANCPECKEPNEYNVNLLAYLESLTNFKYDEEIDVPPLKFYIKPYSYRQVTKSAIKTIEQEKIFDIVNDETMSEEEKLDRFAESFLKLTALTVDVINDTVCKIVTPEGEVTDEKLISDYLNNAPKDVFNKIKERIADIKTDIEIKASNVKCEHCEHEFKTSVTMDQANFFDVKS